MSARYPQPRHLRGERVIGATSPASRLANPILRPVVDRLRQALNPVIVARAGTRSLRSFAVIQHQGRRSGRAYATPVSARPIAGGFMIPLTFGEGADWYQNVRAAGRFTIRWNGADYTVVDPEVVKWKTAQSAFTPIERALLPLMGIERFVRVRYATTAEHEPIRGVNTISGAPVTDRDASSSTDSRAAHEIAS